MVPKRTGKKIREILSIFETEFMDLPSHCFVFPRFVVAVVLRLSDDEPTSGWIWTMAVSASTFKLCRWFSTVNTCLHSFGCTCWVLFWKKNKTKNKQDIHSVSPSLSSGYTLREATGDAVGVTGLESSSEWSTCSSGSSNVISEK